MSTLVWKINRLKCMGLKEVGHRIFTAIGSRLEQANIFSLKTVPKAKVTSDGAKLLQPANSISAEEYVINADEIIAGKMNVFSLDAAKIGFPPNWNKDLRTGVEAPLEFGKTLDYRSERLVGDIKYLWEPSRHLQLVTLAQAYYLTNDEKYALAVFTLLESWLDQCPYPLGVHWTSSLELGIRLINWSLCWQLLGGSDSPLFASSTGATLRDRWLDSVYQHVHFINGHYSRHSSANNHLIGEAAGAYVACCTWPYWQNFEKWKRRAKDELQLESLKQNDAEGVNREQAISYQQFVLDFLIFAGLSGRSIGEDFGDVYWTRVERMLEFIASVMDVKGNLPMIGDADDGYVTALARSADFCPFRSLLATGSLLLKRPDFAFKARVIDDKTLWLLGTLYSGSEFGQAKPSKLPIKRAFRESGYFILGSELESNHEVRIIADAGPLGYLGIAAHGHADALAFTLSVSGQEILIDPGTYAYHTQKKWRDYFRGTSAHNTVQIDGHDQSEIGGNFMWLRKANTEVISFDSNDDHDLLVAQHDGYRRLDDPVTHRRDLSYDKTNKQIVVTDELLCEKQHDVTLHWHFSELCRVEVLENGMYRVTNGGVSAEFVFSHASDLRTRLHCGNEDAPLGWVSRSFDRKVVCSTLQQFGRISGNTTITTRINLGPFAK